MHLRPFAFLLAALCVAPPQLGDSRALEARLQTLIAKRPLVIAHRGDSEAFPENTLPSFRSAIEQGADVVELDFHASRDGVLFCLHDDTFDRTTDCWPRHGVEVASGALTMAEIANLDAGKWKHERFAGTRIPTLEEAIDACGKDSIVMIERKQGAPEPLVALVRKLDCFDRVLVQSFDWDYLAAVRELEPRLVLGALGEGDVTKAHVERMKALDVAFVHWRGSDLTLDSIEALRAEGWPIFIYTVDAVVGMAGARALGLSGVTTDRPRVLRDVLERVK